MNNEKSLIIFVGQSKALTNLNYFVSYPYRSVSESLQKGNNTQQ